jgi:hypothetical protein
VPAGEEEAVAKFPRQRWADPMLQIHLFVDDLDAAGYATGMATFTLLPQLARASLAALRR